MIGRLALQRDRRGDGPRLVYFKFDIGCGDRGALGVAVAVSIVVAVGVPVAVGVRVGVSVFVAVDVAVGVGVGPLPTGPIYLCRRDSKASKSSVPRVPGSLPARGAGHAPRTRPGWVAP